MEADRDLTVEVLQEFMRSKEVKEAKEVKERRYAESDRKSLVLNPSRYDIPGAPYYPHYPQPSRCYIGRYLDSTLKY